MIKRKITMLIGVQGSGKNWLSDELLNQDNTMHTRIYSFASGIRESLGTLFNYSPEDYSNAKSKIIFLDKFPQVVTDVLKKLFPHLPTYRQCLEKMGDVGKILVGEDVWADLAIKKISGNYYDIIIDDLRFGIELRKVKEYAELHDIKLEVIFCDYRSERYVKYNPHNSAKMAQYCRDTLQLNDRDCLTEHDIIELLATFQS